MALQPQLSTNALVVETKVFIQMIETQKNTSAQVIETMISVRDCIKEQGSHLQETRKDVIELKDRVKALEEGLPGKQEAPAETPDRLGSLISRIQRVGSKYRCPRCFRTYSTGYILVHLNNLKKPCVAKP